MVYTGPTTPEEADLQERVRQAVASALYPHFGLRLRWKRVDQVTGAVMRALREAFAADRRGTD